MGLPIKVGIADLNIAKAPETLISYALGSCVGICLYDFVLKISGMSHILLPKRLGEDSNLMKYADTAIPLLLDEMLKMNASKERITAKIAGGANMFGGIMGTSVVQIGDRNIKETKDVLNNLGIRIVAEDVGGNMGRTIEFNPETGLLNVRSLPGRNIYI